MSSVLFINPAFNKHYPFVHPKRSLSTDWRYIADDMRYGMEQLDLIEKSKDDEAI